MYVCFPAVIVILKKLNPNASGLSCVIPLVGVYSLEPLSIVLETSSLLKANNVHRKKSMDIIVRQSTVKVMKVIIVNN